MQTKWLNLLSRTWSHFTPKLKVKHNILHHENATCFGPITHLNYGFTVLTIKSMDKQVM